ncbi:Arginyl-tRNA synthetase, class Ia domain-containing protein [Rozella allomycis CSF55]|uniref:arginine--tRNA ligase n=1 Tax=Rozella allomycis (strain CSF55) TaxID=988480 RepID=A0A075AXI7_ROZAC|nr:Arginyl-tRNA synthetase, class Ia domain-containing protein [Rozella allomycis CSF55]|eukprot:EPZ33254.1 Arginyl-tRNA synthetase, class Ia domain-containing protein [Rozella allomycis CSF55]
MTSLSKWYVNRLQAPLAALCLFCEKPSLFSHELDFSCKKNQFQVKDECGNTEYLSSSLGVAAYILGGDYSLGQEKLSVLLKTVEMSGKNASASDFASVLSSNAKHLNSKSPTFLDYFIYETMTLKSFELGGSLCAYWKDLHKHPIIRQTLRLQVPTATKSVFDEFKYAVAMKVGILLKIDPTVVFESLEKPKQADHGDISLNSFKLKLKEKPNELAKFIKEKYITDDLIVECNVIGTFINFRANKDDFRNKVIMEALTKNSEYGKNKGGEGKTIVVEYSSPNIAKPFHVGHLRSTIIGNFLKQVFIFNGYKVVGMNYLGDWGKQYGLLAIGFERFGSEEELQKDPIKHLYNVYVEINKLAKEDETIHDLARDYFARMEKGDEEALSLWQRFRDLSIEKYKELYSRLNVEFDIYSGESLYEQGMKDALKILKEKKLVKEDNGALIADLNEDKLGVAVLQKSNGTTLYLTRDVAAAIDRQKTFNFDQMFYVVASQQDLHLQQLFKILEKANFDWHSKCHHINFGLVMGMSTRAGTVVFLEQILEEAKDIMHEVMKSTPEKYAQIENPEYVADVLGLSAIMIQDMSAKRIKNYNFDPKRFFAFEGDTGPYVQYAHARLCSIERRAGISLPKDISTLNLDLLVEPCVFPLVDLISQFPEIVVLASKTHEPCVVVSYLMQLCRSISSALDVLFVKDRELNLAQARLALLVSAKQCLSNGLKLLGLVPLERM